MWKRRNPRACAPLDEYAPRMQEREGRVSVRYVIERLRHDGGPRMDPIPFQDAYGQVHRHRVNDSDRALMGRWLARRHDGMRVMTRRSDFGACRSHWAVGAKPKRESTRLVAACARAARVGRFSGPVTVTCRWVERDARRDLDNVAFGMKFVLDVLVEAGVIGDDDRRHVSGTSSEFATGGGDSRVVVTIAGEDMHRRNS